MVFSEDTFKVLGKLHESFDKEEVSSDEVCDLPVISSISDIVGNLMLVELESCRSSLWISFHSSRCLFVLKGQVIFNWMSLQWNNCCCILLLPVMANIQLI